MKLLIVEDSRTQAAQLAAVFTDAGFEVIVCPDAESGLERCRREAVDLVLTDLVLPGASGFDLCRSIKADPFRRNTPVLVLTVQADPVNVLRGLEAGADGFMTKELTPAEVVNRVRRTLARDTASPCEGEPARVMFLDAQFELTAGRKQLLNVLLAAFEDLITIDRRRQIETQERRKAERAVQESHRRYRSLVVATSQIIWLADAQGHVSGEMLGWRAYTGQTVEQVQGLGWINALHPDDIPTFRAAWLAAVSERRLFEAEFRLRDRDGIDHDFAARAVPVGTSDEPASPSDHVREWVGACFDISDRKRYEAELRQAKEAAESANAAKGAFLANVSHEIRTPMNGILGMTDMALAAESEPEQRERLRLIKDSADALLVIVNDLLDLSKIEAGKFALNPAPFDLQRLLSDTLRLLAARASDRGLELVLSMAPGVPAGVLGDKDRLRQVLVNLVGNAVKFTSRGGVVVTVEPADNGLRFSVRDTGIGIAPERLQAIFEPFEQAGQGTFATYGGTGLGLTITAKLVELMGGRVDVQSQPGQGSTFSFTILLEPAPAAGPAPDPKALQRLQGLKVAVLDRAELGRSALIEQLRQWSCQPVVIDRPEAAAGAELLIAGDRPGSDVLAELARGKLPASLRVVHLAAGLARPSGERLTAAHVSACQIRPWTPTDLLTTLSNALGPTAGAHCAPITRTAIPILASGYRVLVAEDNPINQRVVQQVLKRAGHEVTLADNGRLALERVQSGTYDLVLMDVQMPEMDGFEATAAIRAWESAQGRGRLPIVAMTASAMKGDLEACLGVGMDGYLTKPIDPVELDASVRRYVKSAAGVV